MSRHSRHSHHWAATAATFFGLLVACLIGGSSPARAQAYAGGDPVENLVAPIALYPDPLLAQVLVAAAYPTQIREAAARLRTRGASLTVGAAWDESVIGVAHYPTVLSLLDGRYAWTVELGRAYRHDPARVMIAIQALRRRARAYGYLESTREMEVQLEDGYVQIWPGESSVLYVPVYDPAIVFASRGAYRSSRGGMYGGIDFGIGIQIGDWLSLDLDWSSHCVRRSNWGHRDSGERSWQRDRMIERDGARRGADRYEPGPGSDPTVTSTPRYAHPRGDVYARPGEGGGASDSSGDMESSTARRTGAYERASWNRRTDADSAGEQPPTGSPREWRRPGSQATAPRSGADSRPGDRARMGDNGRHGRRRP